ncbi:MAG: dethiobiotin synthase [Candidatus Aadella gelida]|nr:dethiobiotin synthase [Candidatus Aadella gelida]
MKNALFVTGTDTGVGKTVVTGLLLKFFSEKGLRTITQKWVQTGSCGVSEDILEHMKFIDCGENLMKLHGEDMAPYTFKVPVSPHLAAEIDGKKIVSEKIKRSFLKLREEFDVVIAEGSGGLMVPINEKETIIDVAETLGLPVVIVAENRLGAINQTLLTCEALKRRKISVAGIIFNRLSEEGESKMFEDNILTIGNLSGEKILGELRFNNNREYLYQNFLPIGEKLLAGLRVKSR